VESAEQLSDLTRLACDEVQGYWLSEPLPAEECEAMLRARLARPAPRGGLPEPERPPPSKGIS